MFDVQEIFRLLYTYIYQTRIYTNFYLSEAQIIFIEHPPIQTTGVIFSVFRKEYFAIPLYTFLCNNDSSFYPFMVYKKKIFSLKYR